MPLLYGTCIPTLTSLTHTTCDPDHEHGSDFNYRPDSTRNISTPNMDLTSITGLTLPVTSLPLTSLPLN